MNRLFKVSSTTIIPPVIGSPGIAPYLYCPPCTVTPLGGDGGAPGSGGNGNPGSGGGGGGKVTCIEVPTGSTCIIVNGVPVGVNCQTIYTQVCR